MHLQRMLSSRAALAFMALLAGGRAATPLPARSAAGLACQDTVAPGLPAFGSASVPMGTWVSDNRLSLDWTPATDDSCGVDGYGELWTDVPTACPANVKTREAAPTALTISLSDGSWYYALKTVDLAGNWSADCVRAGPFQIDTTPPTTPQGLTSYTHMVGVGSSVREVVVDWPPCDDAVSGIGGYSVQWTQFPDSELAGVINNLPPQSTSPVLPNGNWWFHVQAVDRAGARSPTVHLGPFVIEVSPPTPPNAGSSSHVTGSCSSDCTIDIGWSQSAGATAYSHQWSTAATTVPDTLVDTVVRVTISPCLPTGTWYFHVRAVNGAQAWSGASHAGPFVLDVSPPVAPTALSSSTHPIDRWSPHARIALALTAASDVGCGTAGYSLVFDQSPTTIPDATIDAREDQVTSGDLPDGGPWFAHVRTFDLAGNAAVDVRHLGPMWIDAAPPVVILTSPNGGELLQGGDTIQVTFAVDDILSGVRASRVEASLDGGANWPLEIAKEVPPGAPVAWQVPDLDAAAVRVRVLTEDRAGNVAEDESDSDLAIEASAPPPPRVPTAYALEPNAPNPFNPNTSIAIDLPAPGLVRLQLLDLRGRAMATLWSGWRDAGHHVIPWDGRDGEGRPLPSGVYVYRLQAGSFMASRKLTILR